MKWQAGPQARTGRQKLLLCASAILAVSAPLATAWSQSLSIRSRGPYSLQWESQAYDPAASVFNSLLSYNAMSVIAPTLYGDFQSPTQFSLATRWSGIMGQNAGFDPAVSTMLNSFVQQDLMPSGGALVAAAFDVGSSSDIASTEAPPALDIGDLDAGVDAQPTAADEDVSVPIINALGGISPSCGDDKVERNLQAGGEYWYRQQNRGAPVDFPTGVFVGAEVGNPLGGLGPSGDPANLTKPGQAGDWCRPGREPFFLSSPLENTLIWIALWIVLAGLLVFWLSRGVRLRPL